MPRRIRDVAGMVLIDPGRLDDDPRFPAQHHKERAAERRLITIARSMAPFGVVRLFQPRLSITIRQRTRRWPAIASGLPRGTGDASLTTVGRCLKRWLKNEK